MQIRRVLPVFLFLILCIHATAFSQTVNIQGYVQARGLSDNISIRVAFVPTATDTFPDSREQSTYTDSEGHYSIQLQAGKYIAHFSRIGYFDYWGNETYLNSSRIISTVTLVPESTRLLVPTDFATVQSALNSARQADTVLVSPGLYRENLRFKGNNIVVGSLYLTTGDTAYISQTVIDGGGSGRVVKFSSGEDSTTVLCGFTIKNGKFSDSASDYLGAAILCANSSPTLKNLIITENQGSGGGVVAFQQSDARMRDCLLNNNMSAYGGMIYLEDTRAVLSNVIVSGGTSYDSGIYIFRGKPVLRNMVLNKLASIGAYANSYNVVYCQESDPEFRNCIVSDNDGYGFFVQSGNPLVSHSAFWKNKKGNFTVFEGSTTLGINVAVNANGDSCDAFGNIQCDPQFADPGKGDFHLRDTSPCIGAGISEGAPPADMYGVIRGTPPDLGAIENPLNSPQAFVKLISPNGGEIWASGTSHPIAWTSLKVAQIGLEYSVNGGNSWNSIASGLSASTGKYSWMVPEEASGQYLIRIAAVSGDPVPDISDAMFTVIRGGLANSPWPMFRRNPSHTGAGTGSAPASDQVKWKLHLPGWIYSSPAVGADGTLYLGSDDRSLYAVNPDGTVQWKYQTLGAVQSSPAITPDGTVYITSLDKSLYAVRPDGSLRWKYATGGELFSSPAVAGDGTIYFGSRDGYLYALNPDGTLKWKYAAGPLNSSPAIAADGTVFVGSGDKSLYALNPDGTLRWMYTTGGSIDSSPVVRENEAIYVQSSDNYLYAVKPDGALRWKTAMKLRQYLSPAVAGDGTVYAGSGDSWVYALQPGDGSVKWKYPTGSPVVSSPVVGADGAIYYSSENSVQTLNPDGTLRWKYGTAGSATCSSPAIDASGAVYAVTGNSALCAFLPSAVTLLSPNGGEEWIAGTQQVISWTSAGTAAVKLEYSTDNGETWNIISPAVDAAKVHSIIWTTPKAVSTFCLVRISNPAIPSVADRSDTRFTILPPTLALTAPNGGETWSGRREYPVTWNSDGVSLIKIEYSPDAGSTWMSVADSVDARGRTYLWRTPDSPSTKARIRISDREDLNRSDASDASFTVTPPPVLALAAPNGGENLQEGDTLNIAWSVSGIDSVKLEYSLDGGSGWTAIAERTAAAPGLHPWKVPAGSSSNCLIRISDAADPLFADTSDRPFTILRYNLNAGYLLDSDLRNAKCQESALQVNPGGNSTAGFALYARNWGNAKGFTVTFSWDPEKADILPTFSSSRVDSSEITVNGETFTPVPEANILGDTLLGGGENHRPGFYTKSFAKQGGDAVYADEGLIYLAVFRTTGNFTPGDTLAVRASVLLADEDGVEKQLGVRFFSIPAELLPPSNPILSDVPDDQGHSLKLSWTASLSERSQLVSGYRIFRSRASVFSEPAIPLTTFTSLDSLIAAEQNRTILLDTVAAGITEYLDQCVPLNGVPYYYWVQAVGPEGASKPVAFTVGTIVEDTAHLPKSFRLGKAYPNPFNPSTTIEYSVPRDERITLQVYNISGQRVATLVERMVSAGKHAVLWDARGLPSGVYFYTLRGEDGYHETGKVLLLK